MITNKKNSGFTLLELLIVIAIIGVLATIVMVSMNNAKEEAKIAQAQAMTKEIRKSIALLENNSSEWPGHKTIEDIESGTSGNEIWDLNTQSSGLVATDGGFANWGGPYITIIPLDPWGNNYFFDTDYDIDDGPGTRWGVVVGSFGPNGVGRNVYDEDNIIDIMVGE